MDSKSFLSPKGPPAFSEKNSPSDGQCSYQEPFSPCLLSLTPHLGCMLPRVQIEALVPPSVLCEKFTSNVSNIDLFLKASFYLFKLSLLYLVLFINLRCHRLCPLILIGLLLPHLKSYSDDVSSSFVFSVILAFLPRF